MPQFNFIDPPFSTEKIGLYECLDPEIIGPKAGVTFRLETFYINFLLDFDPVDPLYHCCSPYSPTPH